MSLSKGITLIEDVEKLAATKNKACAYESGNVRMLDESRKKSIHNLNTYQVQCVPLATGPSISLIILTPMKILQRNLNRSTFVVWEMKRNEEPLHSEKIVVWCGMSWRRIFGPIFFDATITTAAYMEIFNTF